MYRASGEGREGGNIQRVVLNTVHPLNTSLVGISRGSWATKLPHVAVKVTNQQKRGGWRSCRYYLVCGIDVLVVGFLRILSAGHIDSLRMRAEG